MNLDPQNQKYLDEREDLQVKELEQIEGLIDRLIEDEVEASNIKKIDSTNNSLTNFESNQSDLEANSEPNPIAIEEVKKIDLAQVNQGDLAELVNSLIPAIVRLLQLEMDNSRERIIHTVRPMLDRLIEERTQEDSPKMAAAIARILPAAIEDEIRHNPQAIAEAIAPEIALSIRKQIVLDEHAISQALGSQMGKAIKSQIELEKDAMVDALYPVIGSTIAKYMVEVVRDINSKVERTLSPEGLKRKLRAKMQGVSEAELIFKESVGYRVRAIFLIDKDSGLVIQEIQIPGEEPLDSEMLAGMLTAIRNFANDCITAGSELDLIDYGDWQIPLEVAGYCYLAAIVSGEPPKKFLTKIRRVLGEIIIEHDEAIQNFDGNLANVPIAIREKLEQLTQTSPEPERKTAKSSSPFLIWLLIFWLSVIFVPWGIISYRARVADRIKQVTAIKLDAVPELSVYRLDPTVKDGKLTINGRVPNQSLRDRAGQAIKAIAQQNKLEVDNQIAVINVPVSLDVVRGEIVRLTKLFNQQQNVKIKTTYRLPNLTIEGFVLDKSTHALIEDAFVRIPGVERVIFKLKQQLPVVEQRVYFESGSTALDFADNSNQLNAVKQVLQQHPDLHLKLSVHHDYTDIEIDRQLNKERCQSVKTALTNRGIEPIRLVTNCNSLVSSKSEDNNQTGWLKRYVSFEPFIPTNSQ